jgi:AcrR family transcriptional regulator
MSKAVVSQKKKRRRRDRDATQRKLLDAAVRRFASLGYDGATTKVIAEEAGVAEALIQRYFEGKQGLLLALMKDFAEGEAESCINLPPKAESFEGEIESLLNHAIVHCAEKKEYLKTAIPRAVVDRAVGKELAKFLETARAPTLAERLKQHIGNGISEGQDIEALSYALALSMISLGFFGQIVLKLDPKLLERIVASLSGAFSGALTKKKN